MVWILLFSIFILSACTTDKKELNVEEDTFSVQTENGNNNPPECPTNLHVLMGINVSTDSVIAYSRKECYSSSDIELECIVENEKAGDGFYVYDVPYIERLENNVWVRLYNHTQKLDGNLDAARWKLCAVDGNTTEKNSTVLTILSDEMEPALTAGEYRFVVFLSDKILYAPFIINGS